ncbi:hypothetical protein pdam_00021657, partial [Pocillopora damicornis]
FIIRSDTHGRNTRNKNLLQNPKCCSSAGQRSFLYRAVTVWNNLPESVGCIDSFSSFKIVEPVRGHPARCDKPLRVTLLASEWNSSREGLSTINRHLAILMAKRSEVKVTLLVPKFACSEEEKRAAEIDKIVIREAEIREGVDPLDWLSSPPEDLKIDVVMGHGAKLGEQAQSIRASHSCLWVQVVHTAHEEEKIARGKEKTTAELDLCKLANLVVAIGPKLTEAYEKQQRIITLTPGTFKEFSTINHSDSGNFTVLTFGRGDPEDCGLKGYDIAAKAVVELREQSYHLIFVSAPDDNQEAVKERLLQSGICNLQLTILNFSLLCKEKLKDCFREVDLCIMPYQTEGFGLTALTALSAGLPFLVSGNSGFGDALRTVPFGAYFVVDSEDPKVWAEAIDGVSKKKRSLRLKEIEQLRTSYEEQFSWEKQCDLLVDRMWEEVYCAGLLKQSLQRILSQLVINNNTLTEELTTSVLDMGFRISDNIGSGNSMFHALSEQLETVRGIKIQHGQLRQSLVQYLRKNPKIPDGTDLYQFVAGYETWADYLTVMKQDGAWGDHLILWAAANCFKTCIHVVNNRCNDVVIRPCGPFDESEPLVLGHVHEQYYISIQPIQGLPERTLQNLQRIQLSVSTANNHTTLTEKFTKIASDKGYRISDNQGSGNCMFHALSEQLETVKGKKNQHGTLRQSLVQYLRDNSELPDGTDLFHFVDGHETWPDYLTYMEQDGSWGDHLILYAAANLFKTCIHVVSSLDNDVDIRPHGPVDESKPLVLGHIHDVHYAEIKFFGAYGYRPGNNQEEREGNQRKLRNFRNFSHETLFLAEKSFIGLETPTMCEKN